MTMAPSLTPSENLAPVRRRRDLANFLLSRRERALPSSPGKRRRVRGLRREEVAELAGISASWYTWLEQGRPIRVSPETLLRLASALQLDRDETEQLYILAELPPPVQREADRPSLPGLQELFGLLDEWPALAVCRRWDILEWNHAAECVFGDLSKLPLAHRNLLWLVYTEPGFRSLFVEWDRMAECVTNHFRAAYSERLEDPGWISLVRELERRSPEFRAKWTAHGVTRPPDWTKLLNHPTAGRLTLHTLTLLAPGGDIRVMLLRPADEDTRLKISALRDMMREPRQE